MAGFDVTVRFNLGALGDRLNAIKKQLGDRAIVSALNKTAAQARTKMSQVIRQEYSITAAEVRERLRVRKAFKERGAGLYSSYLIGNDWSGAGKRSLNMIRFLERNWKSKAFKRGKNWRLGDLRFKVKKTGGAKPIQSFQGKPVVGGVFVGNGGRTVFVRTTNARLPIEAVRTIGVPQMFSSNKSITTIERWIKDNLPRILDAEVKHYLSTIK